MYSYDYVISFYNVNAAKLFKKERTKLKHFNTPPMNYV